MYVMKKDACNMQYGIWFFFCTCFIYIHLYISLSSFVYVIACYCCSIFFPKSIFGTCLCKYIFTSPACAVYIFDYVDSFFCLRRHVILSTYTFVFVGAYIFCVHIDTHYGDISYASDENNACDMWYRKYVIYNMWCEICFCLAFTHIHIFVWASIFFFVFGFDV